MYTWTFGCFFAGERWVSTAWLRSNRPNEETRKKIETKQIDFWKELLVYELTSVQLNRPKMFWLLSEWSQFCLSSWTCDPRGSPFPGSCVSGWQHPHTDRISAFAASCCCFRCKVRPPDENEEAVHGNCLIDVVHEPGKRVACVLSLVVIAWRISLHLVKNTVYNPRWNSPG